MQCGSCGAQLGATDVTCRFCGAPTPVGHQQEQLRQHHAVHAEAWRVHREHEHAVHKRNQAQGSIKRTADAALWWGIGGLVLCCAFIPSVVAVVLGFRARKMAHKYDLVVPTNATIGQVLGFVGCALGILVVVMGVVQDYSRKSQLEEIQTKLEGKLEARPLTQSTACLLVRRSLLKKEYPGVTSVDEFSCDGKLIQAEDTATLEDVRFQSGSTWHSTRACLKYGARWSVSGFRKQAQCDEPVDVGSGAVAPEVPPEQNQPAEAVEQPGSAPSTAP